MRSKPLWLVLLLTVAISPLLALPVGADTASQSRSGFLTGPNEGDPRDIAIAYFENNAGDYGLTDADVSDLVVRSVTTSTHSGATHVNFNQQFDELEVFGADTTVTVAADGSVAFVGGASVGNLAVADLRAAAAELDAADAVEAAADALDLDEPRDLRTMRRRGGTARETVLTDGGISHEPIEARLGWQPAPDGLRLAWQVVIDDVSDVHLWNATIDAANGDLLDLDDWTSDTNLADLAERLGHGPVPQPVVQSSGTPPGTTDPVDDGSSYRVFEIPKNDPNDGPRTLVTTPADATASPFGWHDVSGTSEADYTITRGNNVHAYTDRDANNQPDPGSEPDGGPDLTFDFPASLDEHPQTYPDAAVTNLFYWCNVIHDIMDLYGFDESNGNFQVTNYTGEGVGGDDVRCEAQDGSGHNNANFSTPAADGGRPRMQMFLWPGFQFGMPNAVTVDGGSAAGTYGANYARFSPAPTTAGFAGEIVLVDDGSANPTEGCDPLVDFPAGAIALVDRGSCNFVSKVHNAEDAGATAVVIVNNVGGDPGFMSGSMDPPVGIPAVMISQTDGNAIKDGLPASGSVHRNTDRPAMRDAAFRIETIFHEYSHGVSNRLTGGPGINCLSGQQRMGEGWSDYHAIAGLIDPTFDDPELPRGYGQYALFNDGRVGPGFRPAPYSRNWEHQPFSYDSIRTQGWLNGGTLSMPHGIGHGWAAILWDMTWDLIDKHGLNLNIYEPWDAGGNNLAYQLVMDGLKIQACAPTFVTGRDAIITADELLTGGENACTLWASFARRGLGFSADDGGTTNRNDNTEAFDTDPDCREGFHAPIRSGGDELNTVAAGSTVPLRFDIGANSGLDILASNSPFSRRVECDTLAVPSDDPPNITPRAAPINTTPPGNAGLSINSQGVYRQNWQTDEAWLDTCRELVLTRNDGIQHRAFFRFVEAD